MKLVKKTSNHWICYSDNRTEYDNMVNHIHSQYSIFKHNWNTRLMTEEEAQFANYYLCIDIRDQHIATLLQLTYG